MVFFLGHTINVQSIADNCYINSVFVHIVDATEESRY